jgi:hypothetical protein
MTIAEVISKVDALKPNTYTPEDKVDWLSNLDARVKSQIIDTHEGGERIVFDGYDSLTDHDTELLVPAPYDEMYLRWLEAMIDYHNGEYRKYNNAIDMFNTSYNSYMCYYNRNTMPKSARTKYFGGTATSDKQDDVVVKILAEEV